MSGAFTSLLANAPAPEQLAAASPLPAFAPQSLAFVDALSARLMRSPQARAFPELVALGYWMRKANLERLRQDLARRTGDALLVPRGTAFHIAPSNVDTIFVYSWFLSLLAGNRNIVRLSSKPSPQADALTGAIGDLLALPEHADIAARALLVRYAPDDAVTARLSAVCDVRVVWGGDNTVRQIRAIPLPPTATEVAFSNKYSLALLHAQRWLDLDAAARDVLAGAFYNDAYWFDQMACSSPRLVLWLGGDAAARAAAADFWPRVDAVIAARHQRLADIDYVNKLLAQDAVAIEHGGRIQTARTNDLSRIWLDAPALHTEHHCGAGLFFESALASLDALRPLLNRTVQTLSYTGVTRDELRAFVAAGPVGGIDRMVPFGRALDFGPVWDGFDLLRVFMREVSID
jgi:hypothetical protein